MIETALIVEAAEGLSWAETDEAGHYILGDQFVEILSENDAETLAALDPAGGTQLPNTGVVGGKKLTLLGLKLDVDDPHGYVMDLIDIFSVPVTVVAHVSLDILQQYDLVGEALVPRVDLEGNLVKIQERYVDLTAAVLKPYWLTDVDNPDPDTGAMYSLPTRIPTWDGRGSIPVV